MNGRWGTICNNSQEGIAGAVCSQLGFPAEGMFIVLWDISLMRLFRTLGALTEKDQSNVGGKLVLNCTQLSGGVDINCTKVDNCSSDNIGIRVMCRTYQEIAELEINQTIIATRPQCSDPQSNSHTEAPNEMNCDTAQQNPSQPNVNCDSTSTAALGGVVGVLLALLVVLVIGWSLSCVALMKRNSTTQKQKQ